MMKKLFAACAAVGLVAAATVSFTSTADAAPEIPLPAVPIPALPPQLDPVLSIVAPIVRPHCTSITLLSVLAPALIPTAGLPVALPSTFALFAPVFAACGEFAVPASSPTYVCAMDDQITALISLTVASALGTDLPLDTRFVGPLVESLEVIQKKIPASAGGTAPDLGQTGYKGFACRTIGGTPTLSPTDPPEEGDGPVVDLPTSVEGVSFDQSDFLDAIAPVTDAANLSPVTSTRTTTKFFNNRFAYPIVFLLPLLLLALGGYVGRVVTRPIR